MVKIRKSIDSSLLAGGKPADWLEQIQQERDEEAMAPLLKALQLAKDCKTENQKLKADCINQGLDMAGILAGLNLDTETLAAACVYSLLRDGYIAPKTIKEELGLSIYKLLSGVKKMASQKSAKLCKG